MFRNQVIDFVADRKLSAVSKNKNSVLFLLLSHFHPPKGGQGTHGCYLRSGTPPCLSLLLTGV